LLDGLKEAIDKQGDVLKEQHQASREFMKDLMLTHVGHLTSELTKTNQSLAEHAKTLYPMIREARDLASQISERVKVLESVRISEDKVKALISEKVKGLAASCITSEQVKSILAEDENIIWVSRARSRTAKVMITVVAGIVLAVIFALPRIIAFFSSASHGGR